MTARLVQVTNVSTSVTKEQLKSLFSHLGRIEDVQLYPESETLIATLVKLSLVHWIFGGATASFS